jgi:hypothetical protein
MEILDKIRQDLISEKSSGVVIVHACPKTIHQIINDINNSYGGMIDFSSSVKRNEFKFELDKLTLQFVHNSYIEENHYKLIPNRYYNSIQRIDKTNFGLISIYNPENKDTLSTTKDCINFCIAKNIDFNFVSDEIENQKIPFTKIYTKNPYKYVFEKLGVNKNSIDIAGDIALEMLNEKIERITNYYTYKPSWLNN